MGLNLIFQSFIFSWFSILYSFAPVQHKKQATINYIRISQDFIYDAKTGENTNKIQDTLNNAPEDSLAVQLNSDAKRLAFWLNIYNGYIQVLLKGNPDLFKTRSSFFSAKQIHIAGNTLSLDLIEHGILRHSKVKWSEGYLTKFFPSGFERKFRVQKLDFRIHFALNCGAKSCPPIAFYDPDQINQQLSLALKTYLKGETQFDEKENIVRVPALMGWFRHDFQGEKGTLKILRQIGIIPETSSPKIRYNKYDWTLALNNYKS